MEDTISQELAYLECLSLCNYAAGTNRLRKPLQKVPTLSPVGSVESTWSLESYMSSREYSPLFGTTRQRDFEEEVLEESSPESSIMSPSISRSSSSASSAYTSSVTSYSDLSSYNDSGFSSPKLIKPRPQYFQDTVYKKCCTLGNVRMVCIDCAHNSSNSPSYWSEDSDSETNKAEDDLQANRFRDGLRSLSRRGSLSRLRMSKSKKTESLPPLPSVIPAYVTASTIIRNNSVGVTSTRASNGKIRKQLKSSRSCPTTPAVQPSGTSTWI